MCLIESFICTAESCPSGLEIISKISQIVLGIAVAIIAYQQWILAKNKANKLGLPYVEGVYAGFSGPYYESKAEIRMNKTMGSDAVGMSTVPETIVANYLGLNTLAFATITNMATGIQKMKHSHDNVVKMANEASAKLALWIKEIVGVL